MEGFKAKLRVAIVVILATWIVVAALYGLLKPISNGCVMTYMYPTYIPIPTPKNVSAEKYGLHLYHEGWKRIDYKEHLKQLSGIPVLFIPGNGGSYKQVRSLAAECERAYQVGPLERTHYQESILTFEDGGTKMDFGGFQLPNQYVSKMDWFAVDLEGEHSAMDARIIEDHTEYTVYAIHRILDLYKESQDAREKDGAATPRNLPKSVILVGHSMGGFVARAALIHPRLRKSAVETLLTLSSPHQSPPLALQPSLGHYYARVNEEWRQGYEIQTTRAGIYISDPLLSHVVVISVSGGYNDYQVRSKIESLDGIVPPTHGFMISSTGMKNVWLSMEHQAILWCNQLVVQVSHTLLSLIESRTGQLAVDPRKRLSIFARMLHSGIPQSFNWMMQPQLPSQLTDTSKKDNKAATGSKEVLSYGCPSNVPWNDNGLEKDLYVQTTTVTVLAMDGKRRWLDIQKLGSNGKNHFVLVTNLAPCYGVRLHLWPEKSKTILDFPPRKRVIEVTSKMVHIPSGPAPKQIEPGSQTEQPPPSAIFWLAPKDMQGFKFLTISVAPRPTVSGRPPPAASMAVGQFFNPKEGQREFSPKSMLLSTYSPEDLFLKEDHPLAFNLSFAVSLGLLPVSLSVKTAGCGIRNSGLPDDEAGDMENNRLCKLRCFPPLALAWDPISGFHVFPNVYSENIIVDSSPALWGEEGSEKTIVMLLVDPHCSYKTSIAVSVTGAASRFILLFNAQIVGFSIAVVFFALMRQANAWDLDLPIPSVLTVVESNLRMPSSFLFLAIAPILLSLVISLLMSQPLPPLASFTLVSVICYLIANGFIILLVLISQLVFYATAIVHVFFKTRSQGWEANFIFSFLNWFISLSSSFFSLKVVRVLRVNPLLVTAMAATTLGSFVHPALGLFILLIYHALACHNSLCNFLTASFRSHARGRQFINYENSSDESQEFASKIEDCHPNSPSSPISFMDTQLELFNHRHGLLILHLLAAFMFVPSLAAWFQRIGTSQTFPWLLDSILCTGVILHGTLSSKPEFNSLFTFPSILSYEMRLNIIYLIAGYYAFLSGLALAPFRVFYVMAAVGFVMFALKIFYKRKWEKEGQRFFKKKHSHRH
ncbi:hypothetical protein ACFE04_009616 [Oxalis oulophora]